MYGDVYPDSSLASTPSQSYPTSSYTILSSTSFAATYQYSKTISYTGSSYSLVDPILGSAIPEDSYEGYYTYRSATTTSGAEPYYIVRRNGTGTNYHYVRLSGTKQLTDFNMMIGDSLTDNGDDTYTINNASIVTPMDWHDNYASYKEQYTCGDATTTTCTNPRYLSNTAVYYYTYVNAGEKVTISKTRNGLNLTDTMIVRMDEWYKNYSTYSDYKYTCGDTSTTCTESTLRMIDSYNATGYKYAPNHYYGSSVTWDGTNYTLVDPIEIENYNNLDNISTHHYICSEVGHKSCNQVAFITSYFGSSSQNSSYYYILLKDGVDNTEIVLDDMLKKNKSNSTIKSGIDAWYKHFFLEKYDTYLEDTIFCNDRSINSLGGWNSSGELTPLYFKGHNITNDFSCINETDKFSISNNNAKLTYKTGLITTSEMFAMQNNNLSDTNHWYWVSSPALILHDFTYNRYLRTGGYFDYYERSSTALGVRNVVSLLPDIKYVDGDGSMANPYYVGDVYNITNSSSMFHVKEKSPPGWEVKLESDDYVVTSFKLNGTLVEGDSFIMPEEDVIITDIQYVVANYSITNSDSSVTVPSTGRYRSTITLEAEEGYAVASFKMNGTLIEGNSFVMPAEDVVITEITKIRQEIVESDHNPYANSINNVTYYENTFDGATSITVELTYQTEGTNWDWIYLYDSVGSTTPFNNKKYGGKTLTTETLTINSNYLKIVFKTDSGGNDYYGFKAVITPNY